jgi:hypothetical protein
MSGKKLMMNSRGAERKQVEEKEEEKNSISRQTKQISLLSHASKLATKSPSSHAFVACRA